MSIFPKDSQLALDARNRFGQISIFGKSKSFIDFRALAFVVHRRNQVFDDTLYMCFTNHSPEMNSTTQSMDRQRGY